VHHRGGQRLHPGGQLVLLSWLAIYGLGLGLLGALLTFNLTWWVLVLGQFTYI
jgi:multidrug resistance protein, MATE family